MTEPDTQGWRRVRALWIVAVGVGITGYAILLLDHVTAPGNSYDYWLEPLVGSIFFYTVGILIHRRLPRHLVGHVLLAGALVASLQTLTGAYGHLAIWGAFTGLPLGPHAAWASQLFQFGFVLSLIALLYLFPTGRLVTPGWRYPVGALVGGATLETVTIAVRPGVMDIGGVPNPLAWTSASDVVAVLTPVEVGLVAVGIIGGVVSPIVRYRWASGLERLQLRWFAFGAAVAVGLVVSPLGEGDVSGSIIWGIAPGLLPLTAGIAILRYRLYDLGLVVRRTVTYAVLVAMLVTIYAGAVLGLGTLGRAAVGDSSDLVVAASTLVAAALFQPLRSRIQRAVDGRFDRTRAGAEATVEGFGRALRDQIDIAGLRRDLERTAVMVARPRSVSLWLAPSVKARPTGPVTVPER